VLNDAMMFSERSRLNAVTLGGDECFHECWL
jgi:hypothetical protein